MVMNNMWMFLYKVVGPALALCLIAIASQIVIYNVVGMYYINNNVNEAVGH